MPVVEPKLTEIPLSPRSLTWVKTEHPAWTGWGEGTNRLQKITAAKTKRNTNLDILCPPLKILAELPRWAQKNYAHVGNPDLKGEQLFEIVKELARHRRVNFEPIINSAKAKK